MNFDETEATTGSDAVPLNPPVPCDAAISVWDARLAQMYFDSLAKLAYSGLH